MAPLPQARSASPRSRAPRGRGRPGPPGASSSSRKSAKTHSHCTSTAPAWLSQQSTRRCGGSAADAADAGASAAAAASRCCCRRSRTSPQNSLPPASLRALSPSTVADDPRAGPAARQHPGLSSRSPLAREPREDPVAHHRRAPVDPIERHLPSSLAFARALLVLRRTRGSLLWPMRAKLSSAGNFSGKYYPESQKFCVSRRKRAERSDSQAPGGRRGEGASRREESARWRLQLRARRRAGRGPCTGR